MVDYSQPSLNFNHQPIWLQSFLALFNCESVPYILFTRAAQPSTRWDNAGELVRVDLNCLHLVDPEFERLLGKPLWSERFANIENRTSHVEDLIERGDADANGLDKCNKDFLLTILTIAASAFPEPWCEVIWKDVEEELWEVVESTCLPVLGVLDRDDMEIFLETYLSHQKSEVLFMLITFFIRVSVLLASRTPPNLLQLISQSIELFRDYIKVGMDASQEDLDYLLLSKLIADILIDKDQLPMVAGRLHSLSHNSSMRSNAAIGFALGTLPTNWIRVVSNEYSKWTPILPDTPSTMEVLVQSQLLGTISLAGLSSTGLESLPTRVLMGFAEAKKKAFFNATKILEPLIRDVEKVYGKASLEFLLVGTTLINSFNATEREVDGEKFGRYFWLSTFGSFTTRPSTGPKQQTYLMVAISDSFLGQGKYVEARELLMEVLNHNLSDTDLVMSATLRLLKMGRRERSPSTLFEDWRMLGRAVKGFDQLSDILKYECIEETVCHLFILEPDQMAKIPGASCIVKTLTDYCITSYKGSTPSRLNLHRNLQELRNFRNKLNLFSISGPQLSYCRKLRERFLLAPIQIIEKVGSANWQRSQRIKEIREVVITDVVKPRALVPAKSTFLDSGIGSSLKTDSVVPSSALKATRSVTSILSFISYEDGAMRLPPLPPATSTGERSCYICEKSIKDIENESQWRRHAFSDLRPYVCIVDDCAADHMDFASRAEFAAHLSEHRYINLWTCAQCGQTEGKRYLVQDHINSKHVTSGNENQNIDIIQKSILRDVSSQSCPFCGEAPGVAKFVGHLCHHLEEISLSAIPRDSGVDEGDERETSLGSSPSRRRDKEMFAIFDQPFDEIGKATSGFSRDEDSPSTLFPLTTASQKLERGLREQPKNRIEDVDFQFKKEDPSHAQASKGMLLQQATQTRHGKAVVQQQLEKGANIEANETEREMALYGATQYGHAPYTHTTSYSRADDVQTFRDQEEDIYNDTDPVEENHDSITRRGFWHGPLRPPAGWSQQDIRSRRREGGASVASISVGKRSTTHSQATSSSATTAAATTSTTSLPTFPCTFAFAGCTSCFASKNEWKRHVASKHTCFNYWECRLGSCLSPLQEGIFSRKDLFAQHLRRMHVPPPLTAGKNGKEPFERTLADLLANGKRDGRRLIREIRCPVPGCGARWEGERAWDERMEHVARHWESVGRGETEAGWCESGGGLLEWAEREGVVKKVGEGWVLGEEVGKVEGVGK
ncbi:hypothetical protein VE03_01775 [Pseudogymnoascus sp. 23342-1-I1]|nr:hypothetical protein VE03_01775 [Pseudogymnoascus sp. 23342-1-I1]